MPGAAQCNPRAPPATHLQKDQLNSYQSCDTVYLQFWIIFSIKGKNIVPATLGFWTDMKTGRRTGAAVPGVLPQCPSAEIPLVSSFRMDIWKMPIFQSHLIWITSHLWHHSHPQIFWAIGQTRVLISGLCLLQQSSLLHLIRSRWKSDWWEIWIRGMVWVKPYPWAWYGPGQSWDLSICPAGTLFRIFYVAHTGHVSLCNMGHSNLALWRPLKIDPEMYCCVFKKPDTKASRMDL